MKSSKELEQEFRADMNALLTRHNAVMEVVDNVIVISIHTAWDEKSGVVSNYCEFEV
jgi:hypothetical protein